MHKIEVLNKNISIDIPEHWNEMTDAQVEYIFKIVPLLSSKQMSLADFKVRVVLYFIPTHISSRAVAKQVNGNGGDLAESVLWIYDKLFDYLLVEVENNYMLNFNSPVQFLPVINDVKGPGTLLQGISYGRFMTACSMLESIESSSVDKLLCHLYPGVDPTSVEDWKKALVVMWFRSCMVQIQGDGVCIDGRDINFSVLFRNVGNSSKSSSTPSIGIDQWRSVLFTIAEGGALGDVEAVKQADVYEVLMYLLKMYNDAKDKRN